MKNYPTPHINATPDDFAKTVLMPGDPLRSEFIAKNMLEGAKLINNVRSINGYTGTYKGKRVTVMASGMGMPSIGIYSYELYNFFNVDNIIRVGTAGALDENINIRDIVLAIGASTNSAFASQYNLGGTFSATASYTLLRDAHDIATNKGAVCHIGNVLSSDTFYSADTAANEKWRQMGIKCIEMEAAALYMNAARAKKNALAILTISDNIITGAQTSAEERQTSFTDMMEIALETAIKQS
ncbi:MAG: purine-nucleoside phosphorylase [Clostridia bacterium]|nr:purine-nucleoside phosphorylase [Clostridia bacterium]MBR2885966.1 purine-nucleoside phosphorylase [Clostridia bacterium]